LVRRAEGDLVVAFLVNWKSPSLTKGVDRGLISSQIDRSEDRRMRGEVIYFYAFDVANEIVFGRVRTLLGNAPKPFPLPSGPAAPKDIPFRSPLSAEWPGKVTVLNKAARVRVHVHSVGVISIAIRMDFEITSLGDLFAFHRPTLDDDRSLDVYANDICRRVLDELIDALNGRGAIIEPEAYTVFAIRDLDGEQDTAAWLARNSRDVAGLLSDTIPQRLSDLQAAEALRQQRSFEKTDLVVIDWDAALVVDLSASIEHVLYVLELANLQLEEFRMMDQALDRHLNRAYEDLEARSVTLFGIASSVLRKLRKFRIDVTRLADEVTHISKLFGDWYLARVYMLARERFHLDQWRASVESRLAQLDQLYSVVHSDLNERRMFWLEVIVVILIAVEIVAAFWGR